MAQEKPKFEFFGIGFAFYSLKSKIPLNELCNHLNTIQKKYEVQKITHPLLFGIIKENMFESKEEIEHLPKKSKKIDRLIKIYSLIVKNEWYPPETDFVFLCDRSECYIEDLYPFIDYISNLMNNFIDKKNGFDITSSRMLAFENLILPKDKEDQKMSIVVNDSSYEYYFPKGLEKYHSETYYRPCYWPHEWQRKCLDLGIQNGYFEIDSVSVLPIDWKDESWQEFEIPIWPHIGIRSCGPWFRLPSLSLEPSHIEYLQSHESFPTVVEIANTFKNCHHLISQNTIFAQLNNYLDKISSENLDSLEKDSSLAFFKPTLVKAKILKRLLIEK